MTRHTRYQGAIIYEHHILLIQQTEHTSGYSYWLIPGGGIEPGETEEACVQREMQEETGLQIHVRACKAAPEAWSLDGSSVASRRSE